MSVPQKPVRLVNERRPAGGQNNRSRQSIKTTDQTERDDAIHGDCEGE
jgi:hypothetical protein